MQFSRNSVHSESVGIRHVLSQFALAAFNLISYFYSQDALVKAYYDLDPDCMEKRKKSDPIRKYAPAYARNKDD